MHPVVLLPPAAEGAAPAVAARFAAAGLADWAAGAVGCPAAGSPPVAGDCFAWDPPWPADLSALEWLPAAAAPPTADAPGGLPAGRYRLGVDPAALPAAAELRRDYRYPGAAVAAGGGSWLVPEVDALPCAYGVNPDGTWHRTAAPAVEALSARLRGLRRMLAGAGGGKPAAVRTDHLLDLSAAALRLNYRLTPELCGRLGLLTAEVRVRADGEVDRSAEWPVLFAALGAG